MAQPVNSALSVAQLTYELQLASQWMLYAIGSSSASLLNPPNSQLEVFNLVNGTFIFTNYVSVFNAGNDNIYSLESGSAPRLPGFINPAHLRLSAHFQGTGTFPTGVDSVDAPVYNSNNGSTAKMFIQNQVNLTPPSLLTGGTPSATSTQTGQPASNAFDGSQVTYWESNASSLVPAAGGVASATSTDDSNSASNAFDGNTNTFWTNSGPVELPTPAGTPSLDSYLGVAAGTVVNAFDGLSSTSVETGILTMSQALSLPWPSGSATLIFDFGAGNNFVIRTFTCQGPTNEGGGAPGGTFYSSTDGVNYTQILGPVNLAQDNGQPLTHTATTFLNARYLKIVAGVGFSSAINNNSTLTIKFFQTLSDQVANYNYQMGATEAFAANNYSIAAPNASQQPTGWLLQGSNDGTNWTTLDTQSSIALWPFSGSFSNSTSYSYYRVQFNASNSTYDNDLVIQDIKIWNSSTVASYLGTNPQTLKYDLGSGNSTIPQQYTLNSSAFQPTAWTFQGSNDNSTWTVLDTVSAYAGSFPIVRTFANSTAYRYVKWVFTSAVGYNDYVKITEATVNPYVSTVTPQVLEYDLGSGNASTATSYTLNSTQNNPTAWTLQASNDNSTWTTFDTQSSYVGGFPYNNNFVNTTPYRYWRVLITAAQGNSNIVTIANFQVADLPPSAIYDTSVFHLGTSSLKLRYVGLTGSSQNTNEVQLGALPWRFSAFVNFDAGFNGNQCLFSILGKQLEILKTSTGLSVNYWDTNSVEHTVTGTFSFSAGTWYWVSVGRDSNNVLHLNVNGTDIATANLTGVNFFNTNQVSPNFYIGMDTTQANPFIGRIQEVEMFIAECPAFTIPTSIRSTAYIPAVNWQSKANFVPADATTITALVFIDEATFASVGGGVPVVNTDWQMAISCDNGANFTPVTMAKVSALSTLTNAYTGTITAPSGNKNTSQMIYQITSASGKVLKFDGLLLYWISKSTLYPYYNSTN